MKTPTRSWIHIFSHLVLTAPIAGIVPGLCASADEGPHQPAFSTDAGLWRVIPRPTWRGHNHGKTQQGSGFQGFGLGYHLGYGYGGDALGVGHGGGYPFYGGPGYPHAEPRLSRKLAIVPFPHNPGSGGPSTGHPNHFGPVGPLVSKQPVVTIAPDRGAAASAGGYGAFTGELPYPEWQFAPFTTDASEESRASSNPRRPAPARNDVPATRSDPNDGPTTP
jgi:hypothetical protein